MDGKKLARLLAVALVGVGIGAGCGDDDDDGDRRGSGNIVQQFCTKLMDDCGGSLGGGTTQECVTETNACLAEHTADERAGWSDEMETCVQLGCSEMIECWGNTTIPEC